MYTHIADKACPRCGKTEEIAEWVSLRVGFCHTHRIWWSMKGGAVAVAELTEIMRERHDTIEEVQIATCIANYTYFTERAAAKSHLPLN